MKSFFTAVISLSIVVCHGQVTIVSANLPDAGDVLITQSALLLSPVDLEETGPDHTWNFGFDILQPANLTMETACVDVDDSPLVYQIFFNNPFDPVHNSDFAYGIDEFGINGLSFEDAYNYTQNNSAKYVVTGAGVSINGIPVASQGNPVDVIYNLPLEYEDEDNGYSRLFFDVPTLGAYQIEQYRHNECTGYGTLNIWEQSFPVLLVRTEIEATDSVYIDFFGLGQKIERPQVVEYKWLSPEFKVPVLQINTTGGLVTSVQTADIYTGMEQLTPLTGIHLFPNPAKDWLNVSDSAMGDDYRVYSVDGSVCMKGKFQGLTGIDVSGLVSGEYFFTTQSPKGVRSRKFLKMD